MVDHLCGAPPAVTSPAAWVGRVHRQLDDVEPDLDGDPLVAGLRAWTEAHADLVGERAIAGWVVDGHGDLRPEHGCLTDPPAVIDCLEFDAELRTLDGLDDVGYQALECEVLGAPEVPAAVIATWRHRSGDDAPASLLAFYQAIRALRRAGVAALRLRAGSSAVLVERAERYRAMARSLATRLGGVIPPESPVS